MKSAVRFDPEHRTFVLSLQSSHYSMRVTTDGRLVHLASGPGTPGSIPDPDSYAIRESPWDQQLTTWEYPTAGDVTYHECALRVVFSEPARPPSLEEHFSGSVRDLRPRYVSHEIRHDAEPDLAAHHGNRPSQNRETLVIVLKDDAYALEVHLYYRITPACDLLERWVEIKNFTGQSVQIERLDFGCLPLPPRSTALTYFSGAWGREFQATRHNLAQGLFSLEQGGLNTGHAHNPFFLIHRPGHATETSGPVWFGALAFSGNWSLRFEHLPSGHVRVFGGYGSMDFGMTLPAGGQHRTPAMIVGCTAEGLGGASRRMHGFVRDWILPKTGRDLRPVLYNSWEATFFEVSEESQLALAKVAASIGIELFCVDDGWFGARSKDSAGLGDWVPRKDAFPRGMKPLADAVRALGMRFGLWVEPEMVNPDSDLYRQHPDWVLHYPGRPRSECRNQLILDFGRPEVLEYLLTRLDALVAEVGIDFFKWDMNRYATEPGSVAGRDIWRTHVAGLYHIMDELRRRHPGLDIQTCSGGGGRIDAGILARCDQAWTSDNTDAITRTKIQDGFSLAYPPRVMECWVTDERNYLTRRQTSLELRFDVAMRGVLGIGTPLTELNPDELDRYRTHIAFYKTIRPTVQNGNLHRLEVTSEDGASVWLVVSPDRRQAVFSSVLIENPISHLRGPFVLRGLEASLTYRISDSAGKVLGEMEGATLMTLGLPDANGPDGFGAHARSRTLLLDATPPSQERSKIL